MVDFTKLLAGIFIVGAASFSACHSSDKDSTTPSDRVSVGLHQSARIGADITVRADSIQDSRCPVNVNCFWAGEARVNLRLVKDTESTTVRLVLAATNAKRLDSTNVTLSNGTYKVILRTVNPYPGTGTTGQPQTAIVQVTKL